MLPLHDKPILEHLIHWITKNKIDSLVLCVSYLRKTIEDYFEDGSKFGVDIQYATSPKPLATAGQLKTAASFVDDTFVCVYGDSIFDFNLRKMIREHERKKAFITMSLWKYKMKLKYGVIETDKRNRVTAWKEKPENTSNINMGCYVMEPDIFRMIPPNKAYSMDLVIKKALATKKLVSSFLVKKGFMDIGDKDSYQKASQYYLQKLGHI